MATTRPGAPALPRQRARVTADPSRRRLLLAWVLLVVGAFLPWLMTGAGNVSGARGPGLWTFYASALVLASALVPWRRVAGGQALVAGAPAVVLPVWQVLHVLQLVGTGGWLPGPGLVMTLGGGALCLVAGRDLLRR